MAAKHSSRSRKTADERVFEGLKQQRPQLTEAQIMTIERTYREDAVALRIGLATLGMAGGELVAKIECDRDAAVLFAQTREYVSNCRARLGHLVDILETAELRLTLALCVRDDMEAVLAKSRLQVASSETDRMS